MYSQCAGLWSSLKIRMPCLGQGILILDPDCKNNLEFGAHCMNLYIFYMTQKNNTGSQDRKWRLAGSLGLCVADILDVLCIVHVPKSRTAERH